MSEIRAAAASPRDEAGDGVPRLGPRLREARRRRGLNLESAAAEAELSPAHLSRMESGARSPSLPVLLTLARTYATTVSALLGETTTTTQTIIRADEAQPLSAHGWTYWRTGDPNRTLQSLRIRIPAGEDTGPERVHPGEEWLYVLRGTLRLHLDGNAHDLACGDAAHFDSLTPHRIASADPGGDVYLLMLHAPHPASSGFCVETSVSADSRPPHPGGNLASGAPTATSGSPPNGHES